MIKKRIKQKDNKEYLHSKKLSVQETIEINNNLITQYLSGSNIKRLNNLNWLRHEIAYNESRTLFSKPLSEQTTYFDYSCVKGIEKAYDYITDPKNKTINLSSVCDIHYAIATETNITPGIFRNSPKVLEIFVDGCRIHTPDSRKIPSLLDDIVYKWETSQKHDILKAFDLHYDLIMIQPFEDYNKRTSRIIMNWALILCGYHPIVFNRKADKENYKKSLQHMASGDSKSYYKYMYHAMKASQEQILKQLQSSNIR